MCRSETCSTRSGRWPGGSTGHVEPAQPERAHLDAAPRRPAPAAPHGDGAAERRERAARCTPPCSHPPGTMLHGARHCGWQHERRSRRDCRPTSPTAMRARDELRTATLRMALTAVTNEEVAGKTARELDDDEVVDGARPRGQEAARGGRGVRRRRPAGAGRAGAGRGRRARDLPAGPALRRRAARLVAAAIAETGASRAAGDGCGHEGRQAEGRGPGRGRPGRRRGAPPARPADAYRQPGRLELPQVSPGLGCGPGPPPSPRRSAPWSRVAPGHRHSRR